MQDPFEIVVRPERSAVVLELAGELDLASADTVRTAFDHLRGLGWQDFVVDLGEVSFLDSTGVHLLLDAYDRARAGGGSLSVVDAAPDVHRVLELIGVADRLEPPRASLRPV